MGERIPDLDTSIPGVNDFVIVDIGAGKLPAVLQFGTVENCGKGKIWVRLPPIFGQSRSRLLELDQKDAGVVLFSSQRSFKP